MTPDQGDGDQKPADEQKNTEGVDRTIGGADGEANAGAGAPGPKPGNEAEVQAEKDRAKDAPANPTAKDAEA